MRKVFLMMLLAAASTDVMAGWVKVGNNRSDTFYADPTTIIKSGNKVKMRSLHDYKTAAKVAGYAFLSSEVQEEYECKEKQSRTLFFTFRSKNRGKGNEVYTDSESHNWQPVKFGSAREALWEFACKK